jgi:ApeA N-terminal domain 1
MKRLERGKLYHCRHEGAGQTGHLLIGDGSMSAQLFDYDRFFHIEDGAVLHLRLEDSRSASLHNTVPGGTGQRSIKGEKPCTTYQAKVYANTIVVGYRNWETDDAIRRTSFQMRKAKPLLDNATKVRDFARRALSFRFSNSHLFEVRSSDLTVRCWYGGSGSFDLGLNEWWPVFDIAFDEPRNLVSYMADVHRVLRFFSAAAGFQLTPSEISISRLTEPESRERLESISDNDRSDVEYISKEKSVREGDLSPHYSFICAFDAGETRTMSACLTAWLDRSPEWEEASTLMMGSLGLHDQVSGERLLMACRWLEKIPGAKAEQSLKDDDLDAITAAAVETADRRGVGGLKDRIQGSLKALRSEAKKDQLSRLVAAVVKCFPDCGLDETTVNHLRDAQKLRGIVAHGLFKPEECSLYRLQRAFTATEALSYLLMIKDLPLTLKSRRRATSSRLVRDYRNVKTAPEL